ncbi:hypothetical protein SI65_00033 [Aspergillus cristatus]|uniref:DUF6606 domain-containing protein n=1 Tax=Aspergillus cristatus TaxID=573508 RepID=A0A1E3BNB0_ASPCR|nr:hypothetical protein SI65_00033 [Aspergillus cristatus]
MLLCHLSALTASMTILFTSWKISQGSDRAWKAVTKALESYWRVHQKGVINKKALVEALQHVKDDIPVIVHVSEAGLLIRYERETSNVIFEAFEASPRAEDVLESTKALRCDFPGTAVSIPLDRFQQQSFIENLASFLEQASAESIKQFAAKARKAGVTLAEIRDTVDPALVTQMLMALLEVLGKRVNPPPL